MSWPEIALILGLCLGAGLLIIAPSLVNHPACRPLPDPDPQPIPLALLDRDALKAVFASAGYQIKIVEYSRSPWNVAEQTFGVNEFWDIKIIIRELDQSNATDRVIETC